MESPIIKMNSKIEMNEVLAVTGDGALYTESIGDRDAPAVLLIMGAMASGVWWPRAFCAQLAARGRFVIRYDHRDTGRSRSYGLGAATYTTETLADDALAVLEAYNIESAHLVGMSLGGYLSQLLALKAPARVKTLTLHSLRATGAEESGDSRHRPARVLAYHARAAALDWTDRGAVEDYQVGACACLPDPGHPFDEKYILELAREDWDRTPNPLTPFNHAVCGA